MKTTERQRDPSESILYATILLGVDTVDTVSTIILKKKGGVEINPYVNRIGLAATTAITYGIDIALAASLYYIPPVINQVSSLAGDIIEWINRLAIWGMIVVKGITVAGNILEIVTTT